MKTYKKLIIISLIIILGIIQSFSQKNTKLQSLALNSYIEYLDFTAEQMTREMQCLYDYYGTVESYRKRKQDHYGLNVKATCSGKEDSFKYDKAVKNSDNLKAEERTKLNTLLKTNHELYNKTIEKLREIEIYIRLNDYKKDGFIKHETILREIKELFVKYKSAHYKLYETVFEIYRIYQPYNEGDIYHFYENKMIDYLNNEKGITDIWYLNFDKSIMTSNFPYEELINSINNTDIENYPFNTDTKLQHPISHFYRSFWGSVKSLQSTKRRGIDEYTFKTITDDSHSNQSYLTYLNYLNNSAVINFNSFVSACNQKGIYLLKYPKLFPSFTLDNKEKLDLRLTKFNKIPSYSQVLISEQKSHLSYQQAKSLNNYVEYINEEIRISSDRPSITEGYLKSVQRYMNYSKDKLLSYKASRFMISLDYRVAVSKYEKALTDSRFLPDYVYGSLNAQLRSIKTICDRRRFATFQINQYISNKEYLEDNFEKINEFCIEIKDLWIAFDELTNKLYNDIKKVWNSYPPEHSNHSWYVSGSLLYKLTEFDHELLMNAKEHYLTGSKLIMSSDSVDNLSRLILIDQYKNMSGLKKIGRNHGHCPYTPYEDIPQDSKNFALKYLKQKEVEKDTVIHGKYRELVRYYNNIIDDYNKFVWLAEGDYETAEVSGYKNVYLLKAKKEIDIFKLSKFTEVTNKSDYKKDRELFNSMEGFAHNNLILLLDVSRSMNEAEKLPLLKSSFMKLLKILRIEDKVGVVIYSGEAEVVLKSTSCANKKEIKDVIDNLKSSGSTNIEDGIKTAHKLAKSNYIKNGNNRIILATDGEFSVKPELFELVKKIASDHIYLSVFHYGKDKDKKLKLYELSMITGGNYELITKMNTDEKLVKEAKAIEAKSKK